jgi:hypothetical protein
MVQASAFRAGQSRKTVPLQAGDNERFISPIEVPCECSDAGKP